MAAFLTAMILIVVMGGLLAIPIVARSRPRSRLAQAIRGAGERYNELYLAGHEADDETPEWAVAGGPLDPDPDARLVQPTGQARDTDRPGRAAGGFALDNPEGRP